MMDAVERAIEYLNMYGIEILPASYSLPPKPNAMRLENWFEKALSVSSASIDKFEEMFSLESTCRVGCISCCKQLIGTVAYEVSIIASKIRKLPRDDRVRIRDNCINICSELERQGLNEAAFIKETGIHFGVNQEATDAYFDLGLNCPLLHNNECSVYTVRPISCMAYRCYGDPQKCSDRCNDETISYGGHGIDQAIDSQYIQMKGFTQRKFRILPFALRDTLK